MRFTEHEMTVAVDAVARHLHAATRPPWRRGSADASYDALDRMRSWRLKVRAGDVVLPVLVALPERPTVGASPEFTAAEYAAAAEQSAPGTGSRRRVAVAVALTRLAVAAMPVRQDPDALVVPDHL